MKNISAEDAVEYKFRLCFELSGDGTFTGNQEQIEFQAKLSAQPLKLAALDGTKKMDGSSRFSLSGGPFPTKEEAGIVADAARVAVLYYAVSNRVGINVGQHRIQNFALTNAGRQYYEELVGARILEDHLGITIFEAEPPPRFLGMNFKGVVGKSVDTFTESVRTTLGGLRFRSPRVELAAEVYAMSHFEASGSARFLALFMTIEALIEPRPRSEAVTRHIDLLLEKTETANISEEEKKSLLGGISWLKNQSIGRTGRQLAAELLAGRTYQSLSAAEFFTKIYRTRNDLVHRGKVDHQALHTLVGDTDQFVSDLLQRHFDEVTPQ